RSERLRANRCQSGMTRDPALKSTVAVTPWRRCVRLFRPAGTRRELLLIAIIVFDVDARSIVVHAGNLSGIPVGTACPAAFDARSHAPGILAHLTRGQGLAGAVVIGNREVVAAARLHHTRKPVVAA